jgi:hypothetical protein
VKIFVSYRREATGGRAGLLVALGDTERAAQNNGSPERC